MVDWPCRVHLQLGASKGARNIKHNKIKKKLLTGPVKVGGLIIPLDMVSCILLKISGDNYRNITKTKRKVFRCIKILGPELMLRLT